MYKRKITRLQLAFETKPSIAKKIQESRQVVIIVAVRSIATLALELFNR